MRKIKFFSDPHPHEITAKWKDAPPQAGHTYELNDDEAARWVGYRRANYVDDVDQAPKPIAVDKAAAKAATEGPQPPEAPENAGKVPPESRENPPAVDNSMKTASAKAPEQSKAAAPIEDKPAAKPADTKPAVPHQHASAKHGQSRR